MKECSLKYILKESPCIINDCVFFKKWVADKELTFRCLTCSNFARRNNYEKYEEDEFGSFWGA